MIRLITAIVLLAATAGAGTISGPASAHGYEHGHDRYGHQRLHHHGLPFVNGIARILGAFLPHPHRTYVPAYAWGCHPVITTAYRYGHWTEIGGTLCYDRYGRPFIVPGSRTVIRAYR